LAAKIDNYVGGSDSDEKNSDNAIGYGDINFVSDGDSIKD